jgi:hypothetical protein
MSRSKEQFIQATGGLFPFESESERQLRFSTIEALEKKLLSGIPLDEVDELVDRIRSLKGLHPVEWDVEDEE